MTASIGVVDVERFRAAVARGLGLLFDDSKLGYLSEVFQRRTEATGWPVVKYLDQLERQPFNGELGALAPELTVAETYFFRHLDQFRAFAEVAMPDRLSTRAGARTLSLLSAGCASGEEAYSLAILVRERLAGPGWDVSIRAVDINPASLEKAKIGCYSAWALRETPPDLQRRWFRADGRDFVLDPSVRASVRFEEKNLVHDDADLWPMSTYDVVFCRNVLMYFTPEHAQALVARITRSLAPSGYLFLGHAETLRGLSQDYHLRHTHGTFYYQRKDVVERPHVEAVPLQSWHAPTSVPSTDLSWTATWIETIQRASERIQTLVEPPLRRSEAGTALSPVAGPRPELSVALELLKKERFSEALDLLRELPPEAARDPAALLLRAVLLTHSGQIEASEQVCKELLGIDDLNAGAHYLLALCREGAGDRQGAVDHDQVATYLDPAFAMPRLHLGLLARRGGDRETARRELAQALSLLQREEVSRLLLFGGGFSREALVALCRAELVAAGGKA